MPDSPVVVVQAQLDAYNRRDLDAFCAAFADDTQLFELGSGNAAIRDRYHHRAPGLGRIRRFPGYLRDRARAP